MWNPTLAQKAAQGWGTRAPAYLAQGLVSLLHELICDGLIGVSVVGVRALEMSCIKLGSGFLSAGAIRRITKPAFVKAVATVRMSSLLTPQP
jgi:hypothetical protein